MPHSMEKAVDGKKQREDREKEQEPTAREN